MRFERRHIAQRFGAAFFITAGLVLARYADSVLPTSYLIRPLLVMALASVAIALATGFLSADLGVIASMAVALAMADVRLGALIAAGILISAFLLRSRRAPGQVVNALLLVAGIFFLLSIVRAAPMLESDSMAPPVAQENSVYLVLLDGYPRADTLREMGVDISDFIGSMEERGFDYYPSAEAIHGWTHLTLTAMLTGRLMANDRGSNETRREVRQTWSLPDDWSVVTSPLGHVTIPAAYAMHDGGMNNFEAHLIGRSILGVTPIGSWLVMGGLRDRLELGIQAVGGARDVHLFAHLMAPHPPFLYGPGDTAASAPECWPGCQIFAAQTEELGISREEWAGAEQANLDRLNEMLLRMVDSILAKDHDATIVFFSDHGGRISARDPDEWHRSFLLARTTAHPHLFGNAPKAHELFGVLEATY
jgi:hypothetical protein